MTGASTVGKFGAAKSARRPVVIAAFELAAAASDADRAPGRTMMTIAAATARSGA